MNAIAAGTICAGSAMTDRARNAACSPSAAGRLTDELHDTRPRWLRGLSWGINLILMAMVAPVAGSLLAVALMNLFWPLSWNSHLFVAGFDLAALLLLFGAILLSKAEGYSPADQTDRQLRVLLRLAAMVPLLAGILVHVEIQFLNTAGLPSSTAALWIVAVVLSILFSSFPLLLFLRLRGLARRVRSAHLAEHCMIVGIGASAAMLYVTTAIVILFNPDRFGFDPSDWETRSNVALILQLVLGVGSALFILWSRIFAHSLRDRIVDCRA